ncbi:hypothetical protein, conserved [Eimeria tenella]|uniref:Uncharacterized protein n=1 Tax=Eimeria tenella TaxID=5802 RepID=U6KXH9_EIMTE|nr:hypothetical protein, conserved [Eimeria tenella]CDJ42671.1 hypothetical protein, conserved [Eimeria tenella]|eukprot:XP_013233421.1 hypothetical protein, conserved [Eimeria tenella]
MEFAGRMDLPTHIPYSPQPLGWSFQTYNLLTLVLSSIFIVCLFIMYSISRTVSILPHAYRMVTLERRRMHCFDVDITSGRQAHKVRMLYIWMLRAAILVMFCFVWQYCILTYKAIDFSHRKGPLQLYLHCVLRESDCFGLRNHHHFFDFYSNPTNVCLDYKEIAENRMEEVMEEILEKHRYLLCIHFVSPDAMVYTAGVSIAFSLGYLILTGFEVLVWLLYRSTERWLPILISSIGIAFFVLWIGSLFIPQLFTFFGCWISFVMVLTVPWILWLALAAAYNLRKLQHQKWALWQEQANRPLAQLVDRGRRGSDPLLEKRGLGLRGGQCSRDGSGMLDLDVDMDDVAALKASEIRDDDSETRNKKKNEGHFEIPNIRETLQGTLGLRQKKDNSHQQLGGGRPQMQAQTQQEPHASRRMTLEESTERDEKAGNKPQAQVDAVKTD